MITRTWKKDAYFDGSFDKAHKYKYNLEVHAF